MALLGIEIRNVTVVRTNCYSILSRPTMLSITDTPVSQDTERSAVIFRSCPELTHSLMTGNIASSVVES